MKRPIEEQATLTIRGMGCGRCAKGIEEALAAISGVKRAVVSLEPSEAKVSFDPRQTSPQAMAAAIVAAGYQAAA